LIEPPAPHAAALLGTVSTAPYSIMTRKNEKLFACCYCSLRRIEANLGLITAMLQSPGSIIRHDTITAYSYPHIYLQFNKNKVYINQMFFGFFGFFEKK